MILKDGSITLNIDYMQQCDSLNIKITQQTDFDKFNCLEYDIYELSDLYMLKYLVQNAIDNIKALED